MRTGRALGLAAVLAVQLAGAGQPSVAPAADSRGTVPEVAPAPDWVTHLPIPEPGGGNASAADVEYLLVDRQLQFAGNFLAYSRYVFHLRNEAGVSGNSQLNIDFDPEVETLRIHAATIRRGTQAIDALAGGRIEVLQRERNLERNLFDGARTFNLLLADVRTGDILDYSYSIERRNTEWGDRHFARLATGWHTPVRSARVKMRVAANAPLQYRVTDDTGPEEAREGNWRTLEWRWQDRPGRSFEPDTPVWHEFLPALEFSQFSGWRDVAQSALALYELPGMDDPGLAQQVQELRAAARTDAARALATIRFVQEEIRYTGLELGAGAFRPTAPALVLQRRFGDCKDKVLLAAALLRELGIEATPALVSTVWRSRLADHLPGPGAFDHVILRVRLGDEYYWWDATSTAQGGSLAQFTQSDLGSALLLESGSDGIVPIPRTNPAQPQVAVKLVYDLRAGVNETSTIVVSTRYRGREADDMRRQLRQRTARELGRQYENYYKRIYPGATAVAEPRVVDDFQANELAVEERYDATGLFEEPDQGGVRRFSLDADLITNYLAAPRAPARTAPLLVGDPVNSTVSIEVRLPEDWRVDAAGEQVSDPFFRYRSRIRREGKDVFLEYEYRTLADEVPVAQLAPHLRLRQQARDDTHFEFSFTPALATPEQEAISKLAQELFDGFEKRSIGGSKRMIQEIRGMPGFVESAEELRQGLALAAGGIAYDLESWAEAHREFRDALSLGPDDGEVWGLAVHAAVKAGEFEDAADWGATLAERWPEQLRELEDDTVAYAAYRSEAGGDNRYRLLAGMFRSNYARKDGAGITELWFDLMAMQVQRGLLDEARNTLRRVDDPWSLLKVQADDRFAALRPSLRAEQEVGRATDAMLERLEQLARRNPRMLRFSVDLAYRQLEAGRHALALATLDALLVRIRAPAGSREFDDLADQMPWILDYRSNALRGLGRWEESLAQMREASVAAGTSGDKVSQKINLAGLYNSMGQPRQAREQVAGLSPDRASPYGRMMIAAVRAESAAQLGEQDELESQLEYMHLNRDAAPMAYLLALLTAGQSQAAARQFQDMLADPDERADLLVAVQEYPLPALSARGAVIHERWRQLLQRSEIAQAIREAGTVGRYQLAHPVF